MSFAQFMEVAGVALKNQLVGVNGISKWIKEFAQNHQIYATPGGAIAYMKVE